MSFRHSAKKAREAQQREKRFLAALERRLETKKDSDQGTESSKEVPK